MNNSELVSLYRRLRSISRHTNCPEPDQLQSLDSPRLSHFATGIRDINDTVEIDPGSLTDEEVWVLTYLRETSPGKSQHSRSIDPHTCLLGCHPSIADVRNSVDALARSTEPVLFVGERGSGKGQMMRAIDQRRQKQYGFHEHLAISLAAVSADLSDSELFGHEKGAFTGADSARKGAFRTARSQRRALFLDDIGDCPPTVQAKLLVAIEDGKVSPVGADYNVDLGRGADRQVSIYAAVQPTALAKLRADLLDRLAGFLIWIPPLRERGLDVLLIADHFLTCRYGDNTQNPKLTTAAQELLLDYDWPGNIRQLSNVVRRACEAVGTTQRIDSTAVTGALDDERRIGMLRTDGVRRNQSVDGGAHAFPTLREVVRRHISEALEKCQGNKTRAAALLGIPRTTLYTKLQAATRSPTGEPSVAKKQDGRGGGEA